VDGGVLAGLTLGQTFGFAGWRDFKQNDRLSDVSTHTLLIGVRLAGP